MAFFPTSPANNTTFVFSGATYIYNSALQNWRIVTTSVDSVYAVANSAIAVAGNPANAAFSQANAAFSQANTTLSSYNGIYNLANASFFSANSSFIQANASFTLANTAVQNSSVVSVNSLFISSNTTLQQSQEKFQTKAGAVGATTYDFSTGGTFYHTGVTGSIQATITNLDNTSGRASVLCCPIVQGATPYIINAVTINGQTPTIKWGGGTTPTGNANKLDIITFSILNVSGTYTVIGSLTSYG
jgi:hypothetical protein